MRRGILIAAASALLGFSGVAAAAAIGGSDEPTSPAHVELVADQVGQEPAVVAEEDEASDAQTENDDEGVHGGPIERFHDPAVCDLVDVSGLPGNWTHGDYVSAVEALGDPELVPIAARSACGKPAHVGGPPDHAGGPPEHAGGPPDHAGGPPEHAGGPPDHAGAPDDAGPPESS
jgi:hypothetical protein